MRAIKGGAKRAADSHEVTASPHSRLFSMQICSGVVDKSSAHLGGPLLAGSTRTTSGEIAAARAYRTALVCGRLRRARSRSARRSRVHRRPLCQGIARYFPPWNDQARAERPEGSSSVCISTSLWWIASTRTSGLPTTILAGRRADCCC
jgi:hypothetical protein